MKNTSAHFVALAAALALLAGCRTADQPNLKGQAVMLPHYTEIVTSDVSSQCDHLASLHSLDFGPPGPDYGHARIAETADGRLIGVRAPLADHEQPIIRTYVQVPDIEKAVQEAEAAGAVIAYPPTRQGDAGIWAIYILDDLQFGLWQPS